MLLLLHYIYTVIMLCYATLQVLLHFVKLQYGYYQRWSEYNTNVLEYEYDYFEHA